MKILTLLFALSSITIFSQKKDCEEVASLNKKYYEDFVQSYKDINYVLIQDMIIKELDCVQFNSDVKIILNSAYANPESPMYCAQDFRYNPYSYLEQQIWSPRMLNLLRDKITYNIFPAVKDRINEYFLDDNLKISNSALKYLNNNQINYIKEETTLLNNGFNTMYFNKKKSVDMQISTLNKIYYQLSVSDNNIDLTVQIDTYKRSYKINYVYNYANKIWQ